MAGDPGLITPVGHREPAPRRIRGLLGDRVGPDRPRTPFSPEEK
ncbi:hypothetical protein ACWEOZ_40455 [Actinoplanes sp. NPDC004185]